MFLAVNKFLLQCITYHLIENTFVKNFLILLKYVIEWGMAFWRRRRTKKIKKNIFRMDNFFSQIHITYAWVYIMSMLLMSWDLIFESKLPDSTKPFKPSWMTPIIKKIYFLELLIISLKYFWPSPTLQILTLKNKRGTGFMNCVMSNREVFDISSSFVLYVIFFHTKFLNC